MKGHAKGRSVCFAAAAVALLNASIACAFNELIPGRSLSVKNTPSGAMLKMVSKALAPFPLPTLSGDPTLAGATIRIDDIVSFGVSATISAPPGGWAGMGNPAGSKGYKYRGAGTSGDPCKKILITGKGIKLICKGTSVTLTVPVAGNVQITLFMGTAPVDTYCAEFGGTTVKNDAQSLKRKDAPAPGSCPVCGNGNPETPEDCDDVGESATCDADCTSVVCGDGYTNVTAGEQCDSGQCCTGTCTFEPVATPCDDGSICTDPDECDGAGHCAGEAAPVPCTGPLTAKGSGLKLRDNGAKDKLSWKLAKAPTILLADLGDPTTTENYTLCIYSDSPLDAPNVFRTLRMPAGTSRWQSLDDKGFKYKDKSLTPDGVKSAQLRPGVKAKLKVTAKGSRLGFAGLGFEESPDPTTLSVQLRRSSSPVFCFGAEFSPPFDRNDVEQFKDKSD